MPNEVRYRRRLGFIECTSAIPSAELRASELVATQKEMVSIMNIPRRARTGDIFKMGHQTHHIWRA